MTKQMDHKKERQLQKEIDRKEQEQKYKIVKEIRKRDKDKEKRERILAKKKEELEVLQKQHDLLEAEERKRRQEEQLKQEDENAKIRSNSWHQRKISQLGESRSKAQELLLEHKVKLYLWVLTDGRINEWHGVGDDNARILLNELCEEGIVRLTSVNDGYRIYDQYRPCIPNYVRPNS